MGAHVGQIPFGDICNTWSDVVRLLISANAVCASSNAQVYTAEWDYQVNKMIQHHLLKLGLTRTDKSIMDLGDIDSTSYLTTVRDFSIEDHFDAFCLLEFLCAREIGRLGSESVQCIRFSERSGLHLGQLSSEFFISERKRLGLITIFDLIKFGKSRADRIFID
jgi:hypothetical protein